MISPYFKFKSYRLAKKFFATKITNKKTAIYQPQRHFIEAQSSVHTLHAYSIQPQFTQRALFVY